MTEQNTLICDIEIYSNFFLVGLKRTSDGKKRYLEGSDRVQLNTDLLRSIMMQNRIVTFKGQSFDIPLIWYAIKGATVEELKRACNRIINGNVRYWDTPKLLGIDIPRLNHVDLIEVQPNAFASLKTLNGRLHGHKMQDLPYPPEQRLSHEEMDLTTVYCGNDLDATELLLDALEEPLAMREAIGKQYGLDFLCKSDAQMGEQIIKKRVELVTKQRIQRVETPAGTEFQYKIPDYMHFDHPDLKTMLEQLRETQFVVQGDGKVDLPAWLKKAKVKIGETTYAMGIGGLHSTEKNRAVKADADHFMADYDVTSYYPSIILGSGLYPKALGPTFLDEYRKIREDRVAAKRAGDKVKDQGLKIALNGTFGKLGSRYSILYAPHLMIAVTLTGQLALLMLIERAEAAGIPVVSGNTDGVVFRCPRTKDDVLEQVTKKWETDTGFELESTEYAALYSQSVNTYIAVKPDGSVKRKGVLANPRADGDLRTQMMISPSMNVCADAVVEYLTKGTDIEKYIRECRDIRDFVTVVNVKGGGVWVKNPKITFRNIHSWDKGGPYKGTTVSHIEGLGDAEYLGKVVRFIWSTEGSPIFYKDPHPTTGNFKKASKTDGSRPLMQLPDEFPEDIDYDRYVQQAREILIDVGHDERPPEPIKVKVFKYSARGWLIASTMG